MAKDKINETANAVSSRVKSWAIVLEWERSDGTWYTETKTDMPNRVSGQIDDYITELEDEKKE